MISLRVHDGYIQKKAYARLSNISYSKFNLCSDT